MKGVSSVSIISDTHGLIDSHIINYLKNTDVIIHAGDICSTKIISDLNRYCDDVYMVAGNNDIPEKFDHLIKFVPTEPPEPHTQEDHDYINTFPEKFEEVAKRGIKDNE